MRVLILNHYYWPDISGNAQYGTQLAEDLAAAGMEVHAIASRGDYLGERATPLAAEETHNGVRIHRIPVTNFGKSAAWRRMADALSFLVLVFVRAIRLPRPDVIITQTAPLLVGVPAAALAALRGSKLVVWCQDVWPDIAFALNLFREKSYTGRLFRLIARWAMRRADHVAAIGRCMQQYLTNEARIPAEKVVLHPNWGDSRDLRNIPREHNAFRHSLGCDNSFLVMYSGNMGWGHPFESIMECARRLSGDERIRFVFVGGGQRRQYVADAIQKGGLHNCTLLPYQPTEALSETLSAADVHLVSLDPRLDALIVPSKLYGALAVARPVLFLGSPENEIARVIREAACGVRIDPGDVDALAAVLTDAASRPDEWARMGIHGHEAFLELYNRAEGTGRYLRLIRRISSNGNHT